MNLLERFVDVRDKFFTPENRRELTLEKFRESIAKRQGKISCCHVDIRDVVEDRVPFYKIDYTASYYDRGKLRRLMYTEKYSPVERNGSDVHVYTMEEMNLKCIATANHRLTGIKRMGVAVEIEDYFGRVRNEEQLEEFWKEKESKVVPLYK